MDSTPPSINLPVVICRAIWRGPATLFGLSRDFDDPRWETHTEVPILTGFSVVSARSGTVAIKTAEEPVFGALSSKLFGALHAAMSAFSEK